MGRARVTAWNEVSHSPVGMGVSETQLGALAAPPVLTTLTLHPKQGSVLLRLSPGSREQTRPPDRGQGLGPPLQLMKG